MQRRDAIGIHIAGPTADANRRADGDDLRLQLDECGKLIPPDAAGESDEQPRGMEFVDQRPQFARSEMIEQMAAIHF